jgi:hypothetical protein
MAFACWHFCQRCKKDWCHSIPNPCAELDQFFQPCQSCALVAEPVPEPRQSILIEDVECQSGQTRPRAGARWSRTALIAVRSLRERKYTSAPSRFLEEIGDTNRC